MSTCPKCKKVFNEMDGIEDKFMNLCCSLECANREDDENVKHPSRYNQGGIEFWDVEKAFFGLDSHIDHLVQSAMEYCVRFRRKNGVEDIRKARFLLDRILKEKEGK